METEIFWDALLVNIHIEHHTIDAIAFNRCTTQNRAHNKYYVLF